VTVEFNDALQVDAERLRDASRRIDRVLFGA
jgi:hypothetical protein